MKCSQCQTEVPSQAAFCPRCGTRLNASPSPAPSQPAAYAGAQFRRPAQHATVPSTPTASSFHFELRRLTSVDRTIGAASFVTFVALFLPWFGFSTLGVSFSQSGISAHGYLAVVLLIALAVIGYLVLRAGWDTLPVRIPVAHAPLLLAATGLQLLIVLIAFLLKPSGLSWEIGAYLAVIAAAAACAPIGIPAVRWWNDGRR